MIYKFNITQNIYEQLLEISKDKSVKYNSSLAGNMVEEYGLLKYCDVVEPFIIKELSKIEPLVTYVKNLKLFHPNPLNLMLQNFWVNYQKKYEFNPIHNHGGIFSFILFLQIPFTNAEEKLLSPGVNSNGDMSGKLSFLYTHSDIRGGIKEQTFEVDKTWEKTGLIFKSELNHCVYPFFSEGERITMSGNLLFRNDTPA